jgi:hypothetical protein
MKLPVNYNELCSVQRRNVREEYIRLQGGVCCHCSHRLTDPPAPHITAKPIDKGLFPKGMFDWPIHLHHNHETGMTIGAVHNYCNAVLWQYHGE